MPANIEKLALFGAFALLVGSCDDGGPPISTLPTGPEIMRDAVEHTIVPDIVAFDEEAQEMLADVETFCASPSAAGLETLQMRWRALSEAWNAVAGYDFGPLDDDVITPRIIYIESMRQRGTDYTQTVRDAIAAGIASTESLDAAFFEAKTFDEVGMLALEVLVFEDSREGYSTAAADVLADFEAEPRKCAYLQGMAGRLASDADTVEQGWTQGFGSGGEPFGETMAGDMLEDGTEPVAALLIALQQHIDYIQTRKLQGILDAQLSGNFYPNVLAFLEAFDELFTQPDEDSYGFFDRMEATGNGAEVELVRTNLEAAKAAARSEDREALEAAMGLLDGNLKREIPDALGVVLGLTFTDGD